MECTDKQANKLWSELDPTGQPETLHLDRLSFYPPHSLTSIVPPLLCIGSQQVRISDLAEKVLDLEEIRMNKYVANAALDREMMAYNGDLIAEQRREKRELKKNGLGVTKPNLGKGAYIIIA